MARFKIVFSLSFFTYFNLEKREVGIPLVPGNSSENPLASPHRVNEKLLIIHPCGGLSIYSSSTKKNLKEPLYSENMLFFVFLVVWVKSANFGHF